MDESDATDEAKPKSFIEKLMLGECNDVDDDADYLAMLEEQRDLNAEIRIQIVNCMPGLITLLKERNASALKYTVVPLFYDLIDDKDYLVRAACAKALLIMCKQAAVDLSAEIFEDAFKRQIKDKNPAVVYNLLDSVEHVFSTIPEVFATVREDWVSVATMCKERGCWRMY